MVVAAIVSLQFGSAWASTWFDETGPLGAAALRLAFGAVIVLALVRPAVRGRSRSDWMGIAALGVALGAMNCCIYVAIDHIPIGIAVTIEFLGPLAVALMRAPRRRDIAVALLAFGGVALLGADSGETSTTGFVFAGLAAACWAAYIIASSRLATQVAGLDGVAIAIAVAAVVVLPVGGSDAFHAVDHHAELLLAFLAVGAITSSLPYTLEFVALRRMPTALFGVLSSLGPAVAALAGFLVLDQQLVARQLLAIALVSIACAAALAAHAPDQPE
jgi:inner membrane transporter RhtA